MPPMLQTDKEYELMMNLEKCLYYGAYIHLGWIARVGYSLFIRNDYSDYPISVTSSIFTIVNIIQCIRIFLGHYGNLYRNVPGLAAFLMLTMIVQLPMVTFFLVHPNIMNSPEDIILHIALWLVAVSDIKYSAIALKQASSLSISIYFS